MVCVGIDVAKDKHDCCILDSDGMVHIPAAQGHLHGVLGPVSRTFKATLTDF